MLSVRADDAMSGDVQFFNLVAARRQCWRKAAVMAMEMRLELDDPPVPEILEEPDRQIDEAKSARMDDEGEM
jgi:hypothetical protein